MIIDQSCPQCGAPVALTETDRVLVCPFCKVRLYMRPRDIFRYLIPPAPGNACRPELVYAPYRRFRGMVFDLRTPNENERVLDLNFLAIPPGIFPDTLGLRPQTLRLRPAAFEQEDRCLTPTGDLSDFPAFPALPTPAPSGPSGYPAHSRSAFVGEVRSLIYAPFYYARGHWYDAVIDRRLASTSAPDRVEEFVWDRKKSWDLDFIPTLCPDCGWDLAGVSESCLLFCPQCRSGWEPIPQGLRRFPFFRQSGCGEDPAYFFLPFWQFKLPYAPPDHFRQPLSKLFDLPAGQAPSWDPEPTRSLFLVPAFKIAPRIFLRLGRTATLSPIPETDLEPGLPASYQPVTLPAAEALECIEVIQAALDQEMVILKSSRFRIDPRDWERKLVFFPFQDTPYELIQPQGHLGIPKNSLSLGKFI